MDLNKIFGHEHIEAQLARILKNEAITSSWIFSGISGIGKKTIAYRFVSHILARTKPTNDDLFPTDENTKKILKMAINGTHPDLFVIDNYKDDSSIESYRNVMAKIYKKSMLSDYKAFIIDGAELVNINVFNALLKLFEEPPAKTVIIMITNNIDIIPITLRSRCSQIFFNALSNDDIKRALKNNVSESCLNLSGGSVSDAMKLKNINIYDEYLYLIQTLSDKVIAKFLQEYEMSEYWWAIKRCIKRTMHVLISLSFGNRESISNKEIDAYNRYISHHYYISEICAEIIKMMSEVDYMKLDKNIFFRWYLSKMEKI